jgi:hypothetical protein
MQVSKNRHEEEKDMLNDPNDISGNPQGVRGTGVCLAGGCRLFEFALFQSESSESANEKKEKYQ